MNRCKGIKRNGERCSRPPSKRSDFCYQHPSEQTNRMVTVFRWLNANAVTTAILVAILAFVGNWFISREEKADKLEFRYKDSAIEFRPFLLLRGMPRIKNAIADFYVEDSTNSFHYGPIEVVGELTYINQRNHIALSRGLIIGYSTVVSHNLRDTFLSQNPGNILLHLGEPEPVHPDSSLSIEFEGAFTTSLDSQRGVFHVIHLYENEDGVLYDVYNKIIFKADSIKGVPTSIPYRIKVSREDLVNSIRFEEKLPPTSHVYSTGERDRVLGYVHAASVDTVRNGIDIANFGRTLVYHVGANEFWEVRTVISALPYASIYNPVFCTWLDTNSTIVKEGTNSKVPKVNLDFSLQKRFDLPFSIENRKIRSLTKSGYTFYRHSVVDFQDRLGNEFQAHLTSKLSIAKNEIRWEVVDKSNR